MTTEDVRVRLRTKLESAFGAEEASLLMDRPAGGWSDLVTNQVLEARLDALRYELVGEMAALRAAMERGFQVQTWRLLGAIFVAFGMFATLVRIT
jgi:delta-aminolevulinic acid dehydratase/porphobilinogen synthase